MAKLYLGPVLILLALPANGEERRQLDAHVHGVGKLNIALDGTDVAMELQVPGADLVGFEYEATTSEDRRKIEEAIALLKQPLSLFGLSEAAGCTVLEVKAALEGEGPASDHDHDDHDKEDDPDHEGHEESASHSEFHAEYLLRCSDVAKAATIEFQYFVAFPNAQALDVQVITAKGGRALEVTRDAPILDLSALR